MITRSKTPLTVAVIAVPSAHFITKAFAFATISLAFTSQSEAANQRFIWSGGGSGDGVSWNDPGNWGGEASDGTNLPGDFVGDIPGGGDTTNVIMQAGGTSTTTVNADFAPANWFDILIVRNGHTLNVQANFDLGTQGIPILLGQNGTGSTINHTAGTFSAGSLQVGGGSDGHYDLSGTGVLSVGAVTINNNSSFGISGTSASASAASMSIDSGSSLDFTFGATGINAITLSGQFNITSGALLSVDGSSYTGGFGTIDLVTFGSIVGSFVDPTDIELTGFAAGSSIGYDSDSMFITIVPEPGTFALLGGMLALSYVMLRRR